MIGIWIDNVVIYLKSIWLLYFIMCKDIMIFQICMMMMNFLILKYIYEYEWFGCLCDFYIICVMCILMLALYICELILLILIDVNIIHMMYIWIWILLIVIWWNMIDYYMMI